MGVEYVDSLHDRIAGKVSGSVYVIAPVSCCDPGLFEDMIVRGDVTFFILRVPYSVIAALHERDFQLLVQPSALDEVNDALDSFGFDFMEVPAAEVGYVRRDQLLEARIKSFRRGGLDPDDFVELDDAGRADLAFVMVDHAYDGGVFRVSSYHFAEELRTREWTYQVPLTDASKRLLVIYTDTHGNELRQIVSLDEVPKQ
jgi:hypothetical protein